MYAKPNPLNLNKKIAVSGYSINNPNPNRSRNIPSEYSNQRHTHCLNYSKNSYKEVIDETKNEKDKNSQIKNINDTPEISTKVTNRDRLRCMINNVVTTNLVSRKITAMNENDKTAGIDKTGRSSRQSVKKTRNIVKENCKGQQLDLFEKSRRIKNDTIDSGIDKSKINEDDPIKTCNNNNDDKKVSQVEKFDEKMPKEIDN